MQTTDILVETMPYSPEPTRNDNAAWYLARGWIGALGTMFAIVCVVYFRSPDLAVIGKIIALLSILLMMNAKHNDEFLRGLWQAGATTALATAIFWVFIGPFLLGLVDGLMGSPNESRFPHEWTYLALASGFFAGFNWRRYRGLT